MHPRAISTKRLSIPIALTAETLYGPALGSDERVKKQLQKSLATMRGIAEKAQVAQDAVSEIYTYTIWVASASLAQVAQVRGVLHLHGSAPMFDEFERRQRLQLFSGLERIAFAATRSIVEEVCEEW